MATPPQAPFATCEGDAEAVAKLKRGGLDPTNTAGFQQTTEAVLRWSRGTGAAATMQNSVVPYIYGRCAFSDMADALATATDAGHRIYVLGWWVDPDTRLKDGTPPLLLRDLLSKTKAAVRGMFWDDTQTAVPAGSPRKSSGSKAADNVPIAWFINGLPNGAAILDHKLPFLRLAGSQTGVRGGVHHQKLLVVSGAAGLLAFSGGMDINNTRVTLSSGGLEPLHDVHFRVMGPAANQ